MRKWTKQLLSMIMKIVLTLQTPLKEPLLQSNGLQLFSSLSVRITWEAFRNAYSCHLPHTFWFIVSGMSARSPHFYSQVILRYVAEEPVLEKSYIKLPSSENKTCMLHHGQWKTALKWGCQTFKFSLRPRQFVLWLFPFNVELMT